MLKVNRDSDLLPNALEDAMCRFAEEMRIPVDACYLVLLCVAASLIPSKTRLIFDPRYYPEPPILWGGLVGDTDSGRSRIISTLTLPLKDLQVEHYTRYQQKLKGYETAIQEHERRQASGVIGNPPDRPAIVELYTFNCAADVVEQNLKRQPDRGLLIDLDDLADLLQSAGICQSRGNTDLYRWQNLYEGFFLRNGSRVADQIPVQPPSVSVVGGIQHSDFWTLWSNCTRFGGKLLACFAWVKVPHTSDTQDGLVYNPRLLLYTVYRRLQASPPMQHALDKEGQKLWDNWKNEITELFCGERNRRIRTMLLETVDRATRIALVLHRLDAACSRALPSKIVPADTFVRGMELARRLQKQAEALLP